MELFNLNKLNDEEIRNNSEKLKSRILLKLWNAW
jgi:hypothetical protein